jgi:Rieske Fe-S protein
MSADAAENCCAGRRRLLEGLAGIAVCASLPLPVSAGTTPAKLPPQAGDLLTTPSWDDNPRVISPADVKLNAAPLMVFPQDAASGVTREKSRLNQILLVRLDPKTLDAATAALAADGIVAYAGTCTHTGCGVTEWNGKTLHLVCPCHLSEFDPASAAARVTGPAPRPLPALPLKIENGKLLVAGGFAARVGGAKPA